MGARTTSNKHSNRVYGRPEGHLDAVDHERRLVTWGGDPSAPVEAPRAQGRYLPGMSKRNALDGRYVIPLRFLEVSAVICEECGQPFAPSGRGKKAKYCSAKCKQRAYRRAKRMSRVTTPPARPGTWNMSQRRWTPSPPPIRGDD